MLPHFEVLLISHATTDRKFDLIDLFRFGFSRDANGLTPLMVAAIHTRAEETLRLLITWGANVNLTDDRGNTAGHLAIKSTNVVAFAQLNNSSVNWHVANKEGIYPYEVRFFGFFISEILLSSSKFDLRRPSLQFHGYLLFIS